MKFRWLGTILLLAVILLSGCKSSSPSKPAATEAGKPDATQASLGASSAGVDQPAQVYPSPEVAQSQETQPVKTVQPANPYPEASEQPTAAPAQAAAPGAVLYPDAETGSDMSWESIVSMMLNGEVAKIVQTPDLLITVTLKDGRSFRAKALGETGVQDVITQCGEKCQGIEFTKQ